MAANVLADAGFLVAILADRDSNRRWAIATAEQHPPPWKTCEAVLSEAFYLAGSAGTSTLIELLRRGAVVPAFHLDDDAQAVLALMRKYRDVPMSFADACLVRMTELLSDPLLLTTDADFRIYRRHSRQTVPSVMPSR
jgi:predicted nucleic acid-binding protein